MLRFFRDRIDFDDLIFENRNKEYGAFQLRRKYKNAVTIGVVVASLFAVLVVGLPFALSFNSDEAILGNLYYYSVQMEGLEPPIDMIVEPPPLPPPPPPKGSEIVQEIVKYTPPIVVDTVYTIEEETFATVDEILFQTTTEHSALNGIGTGDDLIYGFGDGDFNGAFFIVEVMPSFRGGDVNTFREWLQRRIIYPQAAIEAKIQGTISFTFIVEPDGSVGNVKILKGIAAVIDDEVVNAVQASPKWNPGLQRGQPVRIRYSMFLNFIL